MRLLANENVPSDAGAALRSRGHDVVWAHSDSPGRRDAEVLARAEAENRIIVRFDKDFGELAFRAGLPAACGIVLFRIPTPWAGYGAQLAVAVLDNPIEWTGYFTVVQEGRIGQPPYPKMP